MSGGRLVALCSVCGTAGLLLAGLLVAPSAGAQEGTTGTVPTVTGTETTPPVTTPPPTTTAPVAATSKAKQLIQPGVTIGDVLVGGLTGAEARELVQRRFLRPVTLVVSPTRKLQTEPRELGAAPRLREAVELAVSVRRPGFRVPLKIEVPSSKLERLLRRLGKETRSDPVDSRLILHKLKPLATRSVPGRRLKEIVALQKIRLALKLHAREPILLPFENVRPTVTESDLGKVIVIHRDSNRLLYYNGAKLKRAFRVATGLPAYPTPLGKFEIITKQRDPWWYPPQGSEWAAGKEPVPPGPGNPLGTRWLGISSPYVGIHGTPDAASIGYSASHGCIRMLVSQAEWLFDRVDVGTPVFIVPA